MQIEIDLIKKVKKDRKAQKELYELCFDILMPICLRYFRNKEDAVTQLNDGFLKIINNIENYNTKLPFEAWSKRIMINTIIDNYRKNKKYKEKISYPGELKTPVNNNAYLELNGGEAELIYREIYNLIRRLPTTTSQVFNLYAIDGYKHKEIGILLGISEGTSKWHLSEGRKRLQAMIKKIRTSEHILS